MTWNYRVMKREHKLSDGGVWVSYGIYEAYYDTSAESPDQWTRDAVSVEDESLEGLRETLQCMLTALDKPVLDHE